LPSKADNAGRVFAVPRQAPVGRHEFLPMEKVVFGPGRVEPLRAELEALGVHRVLIVTGHTLAEKTPLVGRLEALLGELCVGVFSDTRQHVPRGAVLGAAEAMRRADADAVVSFGGGSPIDAAKLATLCHAAGVESEGELEEFRIGYHSGDDAGRGPAREMPRETIPHIAISTTLSAGEFNGWAGSTDTARGVKETYGGPQLTPRMVLLDPELTLATPEWLWGATGMRAMDHAVETVYSNEHQPFADALCIHAAATLVGALRRVREDPEDIAARGACQVAAWMSITPLTAVQTGLSHAIGLQLGARCDVPHGVTSAILLPEAMELNLPGSASQQAKLAEAMGVAEAGMDDLAAGEAAAATLRQLVIDLGIENRLRDWGVAEEDIVPLAEATSVTPANPVSVGTAEVEALLRKVL
jgi:alcohol dehydrogenase class IV